MRYVLKYKSFNAIQFILLVSSMLSIASSSRVVAEVPAAATAAAEEYLGRWLATDQEFFATSWSLDSSFDRSTLVLGSPFVGYVLPFQKYKSVKAIYSIRSKQGGVYFPVLSEGEVVGCIAVRPQGDGSFAFGSRFLKDHGLANQ